jgi:glutathione S-transferase
MAAAPEYELYCVAQSGNAYRVALMLNLIGADWRPVWIDLFNGAARAPEFRAEVNEMGEVPVLVHGQKKLSQSGVCLTYLAERTGKFLPAGDDERLECLRWILFDNQKVNGYLGPYRYLLNFAPARDPGGEAFLKGRITGTLGIVDKHLAAAPFIAGERPTIADISLSGYMFYPAEEFGFEVGKEYPAIGAWKERIKALPGWKHPYERCRDIRLGRKGDSLGRQGNLTAP